MNPHHRLLYLVLLFLSGAMPGKAGEIVLHSFSALNNGLYLNNGSNLVNGTNQDGANPAAGLVLPGGVLCGNTVNGGSFACLTAWPRGGGCPDI